MAGWFPQKGIPCSPLDQVLSHLAALREEGKLEFIVLRTDFCWEPCCFLYVPSTAPDFPRPDLWLSFKRTNSFMARSFAGGKRWRCPSISCFYKLIQLFSAAFPHLLRHLAPLVPMHFQKLAQQPARPPCFLLLPACIPLLL